MGFRLYCHNGCYIKVKIMLHMCNVTCYVTSYHIMSYHVMSYHIIYHVISYIISCHVISYHISCHIIYHIISYHIMPCSVRFCCVGLLCCVVCCVLFVLCCVVLTFLFFCFFVSCHVMPCCMCCVALWCVALRYYECVMYRVKTRIPLEVNPGFMFKKWINVSLILLFILSNHECSLVKFWLLIGSLA